MFVGIVAQNGILLDADERFRNLGLSAFDAMIPSGERRLRLILMTPLATVTGMVPLARGIGSGFEMLQPLAIAVIGGVLAFAAASPTARNPELETKASAVGVYPVRSVAH